MSLAWSSLLFVHSIQYVKHLHDKVKTFEDRTAPPKEDTAAAEAAQAAVIGGMMLGDTLMIGNGPAYGKHCEVIDCQNLSS